MSDTLPHYVRREPFDAYDGEKTDPSLESYYMATQWKLMWWKLKRHRLALCRACSSPSCTCRFCSAN